MLCCSHLWFCVFFRLFLKSIKSSASFLRVLGLTRLVLFPTSTTFVTSPQAKDAVVWELSSETLKMKTRMSEHTWTFFSCMQLWVLQTKRRKPGLWKMQPKAYFPHAVRLQRRSERLISPLCYLQINLLCSLRSWKTITSSRFLFAFLQLFDGIECEFPIFFIYMMIDGESYSPLRPFITVPQGGCWNNRRQGEMYFFRRF